MSVAILIWEILLGTPVGRLVLRYPLRFMKRRVFKRISGEITISKRSVGLVLSTSYPCVHYQLWLSSKAAVDLTIREIVAQVYYGGTFLDRISYMHGEKGECSIDKLPAKGEGYLNLPFVPPSYVFFLPNYQWNLSGSIFINCFLGDFKWEFPMINFGVSDFWEEAKQKVKKLYGV